MNYREVELLYHLKEMVSVVEEYRDLPCKSLEQRMFAQLVRANNAIGRAESTDQPSIQSEGQTHD